MNKKILIIIGSIFVLIFIGIVSFLNNKSVKDINKLSGTVMKYNDKSVTLQDVNHGIYTFSLKDANLDNGDKVTIKYAGVLDKNRSKQKCEVISYDVVKEKTNENGIPTSFSDKGIFSDYYNLAYNKLKTLSLDEKIGQLLLVRYPSSNQIEDLKKYNFSGFVFYEKDFKDKTEAEVKEMINKLQENANIPLLTAVDEEGGKVVRVSSNSNLVKEKFKSPSELYNDGGFDKIKEDTINKSRILYNLGLNLNLAPVVDVSTNSSDYIYDRTLKEDTSLVKEYSKDVIEASKGTGVSYTLKHFPGYGNNTDSHLGSSVDNRSYSDIEKNDLPPFESGINSGAEAVLVSHSIVNSIDSSNPASLSPSVHNLLRNKLNFSGIVITDDISMKSLENINDVTTQAILAGNDLIITTDYDDSYNSIKYALENGTLSEEQIDKLAFRVLAWKYYKLLMFDNQK